MKLKSLVFTTVCFVILTLVLFCFAKDGIKKEPLVAIRIMSVFLLVLTVWLSAESIKQSAKHQNDKEGTNQQQGKNRADEEPDSPSAMSLDFFMVVIEGVIIIVKLVLMLAFGAVLTCCVVFSADRFLLNWSPLLVAVLLDQVFLAYMFKRKFEREGLWGEPAP